MLCGFPPAVRVQCRGCRGGHYDHNDEYFKCWAGPALHHLKFYCLKNDHKKLLSLKKLTLPEFDVYAFWDRFWFNWGRSEKDGVCGVGWVMKAFVPGMHGTGGQTQVRPGRQARAAEASRWPSRAAEGPGSERCLGGGLLSITSNCSRRRY